jgi:hypothetical protein
MFGNTLNTKECFHSSLENVVYPADHYGSRKHIVVDCMIGLGYMKMNGILNKHILGKH